MLRRVHLIISLLFFYSPLQAVLLVGVGQADITPPIGTPSAGYMASDRVMNGVHDPLYATAVVMDTGEQKLALCGVDHLGFDHTMVQEIQSELPDLTVFVGASHTHSGAGAYLDIPVIGEMLAGPYNPLIRQLLVDQTVKAIQQAAEVMQEATMGVGYGHAPGLNRFRSSWPEEAISPDDVAVIQFNTGAGEPIATLFNYAIHPTVLSSKNTAYSADCIGYAKKTIEAKTGGVAIYFNGAQADVGPNPPNRGNEYQQCQVLGRALADAVIAISKEIVVEEACTITIKHFPYTFEPKPTSQGLQLPVSHYDSELNLFIFNDTHAFVTIPGEFSSLYVERLQEMSPYAHTSIFGLTNDAHGYIITPGAFRNKTYESTLSFGGEEYGEWMFTQLLQLLRGESPLEQPSLYQQR